MNSQSTHFSHVNNVQIACRSTSSADGFVIEEDSDAAKESFYGNYLPGLRAVENEVETYFKNDFVWLGY